MSPAQGSPRLRPGTGEGAGELLRQQGGHDFSRAAGGTSLPLPRGARRLRTRQGSPEDSVRRRRALWPEGCRCPSHTPRVAAGLPRRLVFRLWAPLSAQLSRRFSATEPREVSRSGPFLPASQPGKLSPGASPRRVSGTLGGPRGRTESLPRVCPRRGRGRSCRRPGILPGRL